MRPVTQEETTGCGIAAVAMLAGCSYEQTRQVAEALGIRTGNPLLWCGTDLVRQLLRHYGIRAEPNETPFTGWDDLPDLALLAIKWHFERGVPCWHWTVFYREEEKAFVLDPKASLKQHRRTDFGRIRPKWFIAIECGSAACGNA